MSGSEKTDTERAVDFLVEKGFIISKAASHRKGSNALKKTFEWNVKAGSTAKKRYKSSQQVRLQARLLGWKG